MNSHTISTCLDRAGELDDDCRLLCARIVVEARDAGAVLLMFLDQKQDPRIYQPKHALTTFCLLLASKTLMLCLSAAKGAAEQTPGSISHDQP